jgi:serralysin
VEAIQRSWAGTTTTSSPQAFNGTTTFYGNGGHNALTFERFTGATNHVTVDLSVETAQDTGVGMFTLFHVDRLVGTDGGGDSLIGSDGDNRLAGLAGADTLRGGNGEDSLDGGDGLDALYGGAGRDTLSGGNETDNLNGGDGADTLHGDAGFDLLNGGAGDDTLEGGADDDYLFGGAGRNTAVFAGSKGDYIVTANEDGTFTIEDKVPGRDGTDTLLGVRFVQFLDGKVTLTNAAPDAVALSATSVAENTLVNTIVASLSAHDGDGDALHYTLVSNPDGAFRLDNGNLVLAKALDYETQGHALSITVKAEDDYGGSTSHTFTLDLTNVIETTPFTRTGTAASDSLAGEAGNDILFGLAGTDALFGNAGNDILRGGAGKDTLSGGAGQDVFVFDKLSATNAASKRANLDKITDFSVTDDTIWLAKSVFKAIGKAGVLSKGAYFAGTAAHDRDDRIVYDKHSGALYYDSDGNGGHEAIQIASLSPNLKTMSYKDFFVI